MPDRISNIEKHRRGTYEKSKDVAAKILRPMTEMPNPFISLTPTQERIFETVCKWLIDNDSLKPLFIPQITRYAVLMDMYVRAKQTLDETGPVQVYKTGASNISGALNAVDKLEKQLAAIEGKFGFDLKSYGTLKIQEPDPKDDMFD